MRGCMFRYQDCLKSDDFETPVSQKPAGYRLSPGGGEPRLMYLIRFPHYQNLACLRTTMSGAAL